MGDRFARLMSSKLHVVFLSGLGVFLVVLPLVGIYHPSQFAELIGGNYTNVTSDIAACIAAGGTVHMVRKQREHHSMLERIHRKVHDEE